MPAVAEKSVIRPVGKHGTRSRYRNKIDEPHDGSKNRKRKKAVHHNAVNSIRGRTFFAAFFHDALLYDFCNIRITLVCNNRFCIIIAGFF